MIKYVTFVDINFSLTRVERDSYKRYIHAIQGFIYQNVIKYVAIHCVKDVGTAHTQDTSS